MKIIKYQYLKGSKYKITLDNEEILLYEDIIIKYDILLKKDVTNFEKEKYLKENIYYDNYYKAIKYINIRLRSEKEINEYLLKNNNNKDDINNIILTLKNQGYINDSLFAKSYINDSINMKLNGPLKIENELRKLGIDDYIINNELQTFTKEIQEEKINKYINKQVKSNHNKSLYILKQKILNNLISLGYNREDIINKLDSISIDEKLIYEKEYNKIYNSLSKKYSGYELEQKIRQKLYQKGLFKQ